MLKKTISFYFLVMISFLGYSQKDSITTVVDFFEMSFEDFMNIKIVSASREEENTYDAPISSYVITNQDIALSGATSIPDALRLCPGIIVREISNGTYDVSIRGGIDGYPAFNYSYINTSILVMIDNRPVFSSLQGGTYWQNLPIGMSEIERIEIVQGPASALYGPNAVSGVINIISKSPESKEGGYFSATTQGGIGTNMVSVLGGMKSSDKLAIEVGMNYEKRTRFIDDFYDASQKKYVPFDSVQSSEGNNVRHLRHPETDQSLNKIGGTANIYYYYNNKINCKISGNFNENMGLYPLGASNMVLSSFSNSSRGISFSSKIHNFNLQTSFLSGRQGLAGNLDHRNYDYSNTDIYLDYIFKFWEEKISIRPSLSYQSAYANDTEYTIDKGFNGTFNGEGSINNLAGSLKIDAHPFKKLRVVLAGRYDKFNFPEEGVFSYQGTVNYSLNASNNLRFSSSKSYNGSFLVPTLINTSSTVSSPAGDQQVNLTGNKNLNLLSNTTNELGFRSKIIKNTLIDFVIFNQKFENFYSQIKQKDENTFPTNLYVSSFRAENLPLVIIQNGMTVSGQISIFNSKIQIKPHFTIQKTELKNYSPYYNVSEGYNSPFSTLDEYKDSTSNSAGTGTPSVWGGLNLTITPLQKLNITISSYYFDDYKLHFNSEISRSTGKINEQEVSKIKSKLILNTNINYKIKPSIIAFINIRNLLNQTSPEGFGSDYLGTCYLMGFTLKY